MLNRRCPVPWKLFSRFGYLCVVMMVMGCDQRVSSDPAPDLAVATNLRTTLEEAGGGSSAGSSAGTDEEPDGLATLKGRFVLDGAPPANPQINITRDPDMCGASSANLVLEVSASGGIKNMLIYAEDVPDLWVHESAKGKTDEFVFDQKECVFLSRVSAFQVSQPLRIINSDPKGHNADFKPRYSASFNQTVAAGSFAVYQADDEEKAPVSVKCAIHPWMQAWMIPRNNAYFAVTDEEGNFEIPNLPAGVSLRFRVWHEKTEFVQKVSVGGQAEKWSKGRFEQRLEPDSVTDLQVSISAGEFE